MIGQFFDTMIVASSNTERVAVMITIHQNQNLKFYQNHSKHTTTLEISSISTNRHASESQIPEYLLENFSGFSVTICYV